MHADITRSIPRTRPRSRAESAVSFSKALWAFPAAVTLHNVEELILLPSWSRGAGQWHPAVGPVEFGFAITLLTVLAWVATARAARFGRESGSLYLTMGYVAAMIGNVFVPHLLATAVTGQYAPGLATGLAINVPVGLYLIGRALREGQITPSRFAVTSPAVVLFLIGLLPPLFAVGRWLAQFV